MKIKECINIVDNLKPNQYSIEDKVDWLSYIDHSIINEVLLTHEGYDGRYDNFAGYSPDRLDMELIVPSPYDRLYPAYIKMKIDEENGETVRYNNSVTMFNAYLMEYKKWYNSNHMPLSPSDIGELPQKNPSSMDVTDAQLEQLRKLLYSELKNDMLKEVSNEKLYAIVKSFMDTNAQMLKGKDGRDGVNGKDGINGKDGLDGANGIGIRKAWVEKGKLMITLTSGVTMNLGVVKGNNYESEGGESFATNDSVIALSDNTFATGQDTIAGCLGYYIKSIDMTNKKIYLCSGKVLPVISTDDNTIAIFVTPAYEAGDKFTIINDLHYVMCATIKSISNNVVEYEGDLGFTTIVEDDADYGHTFSVPSKPTVGIVSIGDYAFVTGQLNIAAGRRSFSSGLYNLSAGAYAYTEGNSNIAGYCAHGEGFGTEAPGFYAHSQNFKTKAPGRMAHAQNYMTEANADASNAQNYMTKANGLYSDAGGEETEANKTGSFSRGKKTKANAPYSDAGGIETTTDGEGSMTRGKKTYAKGLFAAAFGWLCKAIGNMAFALGYQTEANEECALSTGSMTKANAKGSFTGGLSTIANGEQQFVIGRNNAEDIITEENKRGKYAFIVGNGVGDSTRSNAYTLDWKGNAWYQGSVTSNGADYAEFFEWLDGNPNNEDRIGLLVALDGEKIRLANANDEILGVISGTAAVLGDNYEWEWNGKYLTDDFGRTIYEDVEEFRDVIVGIDEETNEPIVEKQSLGFVKHPVLNPNYDPEQAYTNRSDRPEWDTVGMLGKLYVRDDGTCQVNGYATVGESGVATASSEKTNMRVLSRVNENVIRVVLK